MKRITLLILILSLTTAIFSQEKEFKVASIGFYNLENLFDTLDTDGIKDTEYTPEGEKQWNTDKYYKKLENLAEVISQIGYKYIKRPPMILGVSEIENKEVLIDLTKTEKLKPYNYKVVHYHSPDERGVDVALLYQDDFFKLLNSKSYELKFEDDSDDKTRDQLLVSGILDGEKMHFIVNHWPSRRGGEKRSRPKRNAAAKLCRSIIDSIYKTDKNAKIMIMGDFNDDPVNESLKKHLKATDDTKKLDKGYLYNPIMSFYRKGIGSLAYRDKWNNFDQIVISPSLYGEDRSCYKFYKMHIFNKKFLLQDSGRFKGYPLRTHAGGKYLAGYSDHFPVYMLLIKEKK